MGSDEQQIRELIQSWMAATQAGDIDRVLGLMTDDVVFLVPGRAPMDKQEFAALSRPRPGQAAPQFEGKSEIQEIQVCGDWAFMWTRLSVTVTPPGSAQPVVRSGHTLSVLRKEAGRWLLARDANMLTVQSAN
jgi:uncharacterized protein (TIGR02246 family)